MKRLHLFEFIDLAWWPRVLRDLETDALHFALSQTYAGALPQIQRVIEKGGTDQVLDLCSGAAGPWPLLLERMGEAAASLQVKLSDRFPHRGAIEKTNRDPASGLQYLDYPVDAARVPEELSGARTMFSGFHHLRPPEARAVLRDAAERKVAIGIFDGVSARSSVGGLLGIPLMSLLILVFMFLLFFQVKPVTWQRVLFHFFIPLVPMAMAWDGAVSLQRAYTEAELRAMAEEIGAEGYTWELGKAKTVAYLIGYPAPD